MVLGEYKASLHHTLGLRVKTLRVEEGLSQHQLACLVGLNRSYISKIEHGNGNATFDSIVAIANGLGISPSLLLWGIGDPARERPAEERPAEGRPAEGRRAQMPDEETRPPKTAG